MAHPFDKKDGYAGAEESTQNSAEFFTGADRFNCILDDMFARIMEPVMQGWRREIIEVSWCIDNCKLA